MKENGWLELDAAVALAVEAAMAAGAGDAEAYGQESTGNQIRVYKGEVESLISAAERGVGVRVWIDHRVGYAYGIDLSEAGLRRTAAEAVEAAAVSDPDEFADPPQVPGEAEPIAGLHDPVIAEWDTQRKIDLAVAIERAARGYDARVSEVEQTVYVDEEATVALAGSQGARGSYRASDCYAYLEAFAGEGRDLMTGLGLDLGRQPGAIDPEAVGAEAAERAVALLGATQPASRACPVLLDTFVAASFVGIVGSTLSAEAVQRGRSLFAGRVGEEVADPGLELADDGRDPAGFAASPFDDEGIPRRRTPLIEAGRLRGYLHDAYTARRGGEDSTGNAGRAGYRSPPSVSTSNLVVAEGEGDLADLLARMGDGVYVTNVSGLHSGVNPISGTFSVGASGRLVRGGELAEPVREMTIASDVVSMLKGVTAIGGRGRWVPFGGSVKTPPLLVSEMTVSGA